MDAQLNKLNKKQRNAIMLWHAQGVGAVLFNKLFNDQLTQLHEKASWQALINSFECQQLLGSKKLQSIKDSETALLKRLAEVEQWLNQSELHHILCPFDEDYPEPLSNLAQPPLLFCRGDKEVLSTIQVAVVGSRNASEQALGLAYAYSKQLAEVGLNITSGLAYGIDGSAHQGCLEAKGKTIAVLGSGVDSIYPKAHSGLADAIIAHGGAIISEFPLGTAPRPHHFPQRNRIISGLSDGVLVVEAAEKSGSLITARYAMEQNRDVYTIPGAINNPNKKGCHQLIKQGAILVDDVQDIISNIELKYGLDLEIKVPRAAATQATLSEAESQLIEVLSYDQPSSFNDIAGNMQSPNFAQLMQILQSLIIKGIVLEQTPGLYIRAQ